MKYAYLFLLTLIFSFFSLKMQAQEVQDHYVLKDTLAVNKSSFGGAVVYKYDIIHKELTLYTDGTFLLKHILPKGFAVDANIRGTYQFKNNVLWLTFTDTEEDQNGRKIQTEKKESWKILKDGAALYRPGEEDEHGYTFVKS